ncbi:hypothetical protein FRC06_004316 [Ceratobasidium sp. 370]|nr:hypothetical protein FRC06_004316 [Ceratobasidium sp. 370]
MTTPAPPPNDTRACPARETVARHMQAPSPNPAPSSSDAPAFHQSSTAPPPQHEQTTHPLPVLELGSHPLDPPLAFDCSAFGSLAFDPPTFDPSLAFDPLVFNPLAFDCPTFDLPMYSTSAVGLDQQAGHGTGPGLFWNPWSESMGGAGCDFATNNLDALSAQVEPTEYIQHRLPSGQAYIRTVSNGRVIYQHPTAGQAYGKGQTRWEAEREKNETLRGGNRWAMWKHKDKWETAKWMATTNTLQADLNKLLKTERYQDADYSFKTAKELFKKIREDMGGFGGPEWKACDIILPGTDAKDQVTLFYRDPQACGDFQFGRPWFTGKMSFAPEIHYDEDEYARLIDNPWKADAWNERQDSLPPGTTHSEILLASDSTQLSTHSGDVSAHAVYMTLANIDKSTRASIGENAWILIGYIPKSKFKHTLAKLEHRPKDVQTKLLGVLNRRLFHRCMEIITRSLRDPKPRDVVDPEGNIRSVIYELTSYIADLEEQWLVAGLGGQTCAHCDCDPNHLGDAECSSLQTPADVLRKIKKIKKNYRKAWNHSPSLEEFVKLAGEHHLNGVDKPFWRKLPQLNIFEALSPDLLHGFHKFFHDHIFQFNRTGMGRDEYDARLHSQLRFAGDRAFLHGVSHISQMTGIEHRMLERTHLPIVANAPDAINDKVTQATRGAMECIYLAQLPTHSEHSLQAYEVAYEQFMADRQAWIENKTRRGKREHVLRKGTADNYTTETMEHLHIGVKRAYRASNRREWKLQTVRWLTQRERIRDFEAWMLWCEEEERGEEHRNVNLTREGNEIALDRGVVSDDSSDGSSADGAVAEEGEGESDEGEGLVFDQEDEMEYGERLVDEEDGEGLADEEDGQDEVAGSGAMSAGVDKVRGWLATSAGHGGGSRSGERKRKRQVDPDDSEPEPNLRSQPRPRLQVTHGLSDLQKINQEPKTRRKSLQHICELYDLDLVQLMHEVRRSAYLINLPIFVDEFTEVDTWDTIRTHLHSTLHRSNARMQRIRTKPATRNNVAKNDPILYVHSSQENARTAKLHGKIDLPTDPDNARPEPTVNGVRPRI